MRKFYWLVIICNLFWQGKCFSTDYFWVGGTGNWSDYANHWATSSGGSIFHVTIPSPSDDVYFDANSFPTTNCIVTGDATITNCHTMDWTGVTNNPLFRGQNLILDIYGSLILDSIMQWQSNGSINFYSFSSGAIINLVGIALDRTQMIFSGIGGWELESQLACYSDGNMEYSGWIKINSGTFNTNGNNIYCNKFEVSTISDSCWIELDTSHIFLDSLWNVSNSSGLLIMDADSAVIRCFTGEFSGGTGIAYDSVTAPLVEGTNSSFNNVRAAYVGGNGNIFYNVSSDFFSSYFNSINGQNNFFGKVTFTADTSWIGFGEGKNHFDTLIFDSTVKGLRLAYNDTIEVNFIQPPTGISCNSFVSISSSYTAGGFISQSSGSVTFDYVKFENITAIGGAAFVANNSMDIGNVTGITINGLSPRNLYWVGGSGYWNDTMHWSVTSGGIGGNCIPTLNDSVFFDANSFTVANDTVYCKTGESIFCHSMDWTGVTAGTFFYGLGISLKVNGSFILDPGMVWLVNGTATFMSSSTGNIINCAGLSLIGLSPYEFTFKFHGSGSWALQNALDLDRITLELGTFLTNNYPIHCKSFGVSDTLVNISFGTSQLNVDDYCGLAGNIDVDSAIINCGYFNSYKGINYGDIITEGFHADSCTFHNISTLNSLSGYGNIFNNVSMMNGGEIIGGGNVFNRMNILGPDFSFNGTNQYDSLIFSATAPNISIRDGKTINANYIQGLDGICSRLAYLSSTGMGTISQLSGTTSFDYIRFKNISFTGGAAFNANNCVDAGGVSGITLNSMAPRNLYWVGGAGYWFNTLHWSFNSGGIGGACIPNQYDNVFFDSNSFSSPNEHVDVYQAPNDFDIYFNNMDWTGVTNSPLFIGGGFSSTYSYGSLKLNPGMSCQYISFKFCSNSTGNTIDFRNAVPFNRTISFEGNGSWDFQHDIDLGTSSSISLKKGILKTNGYSISCKLFDIYPAIGDTCTLLFDTSYVEADLNITGNNHGLFQLDADSAILEGSIKYAEHFTFHNVFGGSIQNTDSCLFDEVICTGSLSGHDNIFRSLRMSNTFCSITGGIQCDTLIFNNTGQTINVDDTIQVNNLMMVQSDPSFPSSFEGINGGAVFLKPIDSLCLDFVYLKNIGTTGGAVFFAGDHSVDLGGNSGWNWMSCAPQISNVWPGDCNYDLVVNNLDLLNIGVSFGDTGYMRPGASLNYVAQPCQDWYYQFINAVNVKHADCDGNGIVDAADSSAISLNYGLSHPARFAPEDEDNSTGPELQFQIPGIVLPGSTVSVPVLLGTSNSQADDVYGFAFTVNYDTAFIQPGSISVDYIGSWVGNVNNSIHLEKDIPSAGKIEIAFTRINHIDIGSYGKIATLHFTVSQNAQGILSLLFSGVKFISHNENIVPVHTIDNSVVIVGTNDLQNEIASIVYPNPMDKLTHIYFYNPGQERFTCTMVDLAGRIINTPGVSFSSEFILERKNLQSGIYFYTIENPAGKTGKGKIVIE